MKKLDNTYLKKNKTISAIYCNLLKNTVHRKLKLHQYECYLLAVYYKNRNQKIKQTQVDNNCCIKLKRHWVYYKIYTYQLVKHYIYTIYIPMYNV